MWHSRLLRRTLGRPDYVATSLAHLNAVGREHAQQLGSQLDGVVRDDGGTNRRAAFKMLGDIRNLQAMKALGDAANEIVAPISPPRLVWSGYAMVVVIVATFLAVPVALGSLLGLLLR